MGISFIEVMDIYFKAHKIFRKPYNPKIRTFMNFLEYCVYGLEEVRRHVPGKYQAIGVEIFGQQNQQIDQQPQQ